MAKFVNTKFENENIRKRNLYKITSYISGAISVLVILYLAFGMFNAFKAQYNSFKERGEAIQQQIEIQQEAGSDYESIKSSIEKVNSIPIPKISTEVLDFVFSQNVILIIIAVVGSQILAKYTWDKYKVLDSGLQGENKTCHYLSLLPDEYTVLQNVPLERDGRRTELDFLVLSKYGLNIVEVKNHNGIIIGKEDDSTWIQQKTGVKGSSYESNMKNPLKQMHFQKYLLSTILKEKNIHVQIQGTVFMAGAESVQINSSEVVCSQLELIENIESQKEEKLNAEMIHKIIDNLTK